MTRPSFADLLKAGYVKPFKNPALFLLYAASAAAAAGISFFSLFYAFDLGQLGGRALISFFLPQLVTANFLLLPAGFLCLRAFSPKPFFAIIILLQIPVLGFFVWKGEMLPLPAQGVIVSLLSQPFFLAFHSVLIHETSEDGRGHEVSLSLLFISLGSILGSVLAGVALSFGGPFYSILIAVAVVFGATCVLAVSLGRRPQKVSWRGPEILKDELVRDPARSVATILKGAEYYARVALAPMWLGGMGLAGLTVGLLSAVEIILRTITSPFAGHWASGGTGKEMRRGTFVLGAAWLPWLVISHIYVFFASAALWSVGTHLYSVGLTSRWYVDRTYSAMAAREILLGIGRIGLLLVGVPLYFVLGMPAFAGLVMGLCACMYMAARHINKSAKKDIRDLAE